MSINTNGAGGPSQIGGGAASSAADAARTNDAKGGAQFREFVEETSATKAAEATSASEAYQSAVEAVARGISVDDRRIDDEAIEAVVELAVRAQFEGKLSDEELIERVEDAVFMLADDPSFAPATIEALRAAVDDAS